MRLSNCDFRKIAAHGFLCIALVCSANATAQTVSYPLSLSTGWNLLGNSLATPLDVKASFGTQAGVVTVWKWNAASGSWSFYAPTLDTNGTLASYAAGKGYTVLSTINAGEGYWINAAAPVNASDQSGNGYSLTAANLTAGWNLSATADNVSPVVFTTAVGNVTTLWAWDKASSSWYFHAPSLAANATLASYIAGKGYKDFGSITLGNGLGFWVNYAGAQAGAAGSPPLMGDVPDQAGVVGTSIDVFKLAPFATPTDGDRITSYGITGSLPPGLSFNVLAGAIQGIPTAAGDYSIAAVARDKDGASNAKAVRFSIASPSGPIPPIMAKIPGVHGAIGSAIAPVKLSDYVTPTDGDAITDYSVLSGALPEGLKIDATTGIISGTPTGVSPVSMLGGIYGIQVAANDKDGASNPVFVTFDVVNPLYLIAPDMSSLPPSMSFDERMAALDKVDAKVKDIWTGTLEANRAALVSYIKTQPEFADAGIGANGTVWARFKDGRPASWLIRTASLPAATAQSAAQTSAQATAEKQMSAMSAATSALTASGVPIRKAVLLDVDGLGRGVPLEVAGWLQDAGYGAYLTFGEVADLMTDIKGVSVLHLDTHGVHSANQYGREGYWLATAEHVVKTGLTKDEFIKTYLGNLWNQGLIQRMSTRDANYWAIGDEFMTMNWEFTSDALVYIDACDLFSDTFARHNFHNALASKAKGQMTLIGWDGSVGPDFAAKAALQFYQRALGRDNDSDNVLPKFVPPARPMSASQVYDWMRDTWQGITETTAGAPSATLQMARKDAAPGILLPSITHVFVATPYDVLYETSGGYTIDVDAGDNSIGVTPGILKVNGKTLTPVPGSWKKWEVMANVGSIADLAGPVVVENLGLKSFPVPLTQWAGTIVQRFDSYIHSNVKVEVECPVRATGDAHFSRAELKSTPEINLTAWVELTAACTYSLSGAWSDSSYVYTVLGVGAVLPNSLTSLGLQSGYELTHWGLVSTVGGSAITSLPGALVTATADFSHLEMSGTLTTTSKLTGAVETSTVTQSGATQFASPHVTLGTDYSISKTGPCEAANCTETWNLTPKAGTAPTADTKS